MVNNLENILNLIYSKLYIKSSVNNDFTLDAEDDNGYIEYKRNMNNCSMDRISKYATQMLWRISENTKKPYAIYYIGVDDDGSIVGISLSDAIITVDNFVRVCENIQASITGIEIISVNNKNVIKIGVKMKKHKDESQLLDI